MANRSRFIIAESSIKNYFSKGSKNVFSKELLAGILEGKRIEWNLPQSMNIEMFIRRLCSSEILKAITLEFEGYLNKKDRYITNTATELEIAISLMPKSYLSHYTAVFLHGLTTQIPKTIYVTFEQSKKEFTKLQIEQKSIDAAFTKQQRKSGTMVVFNEYTILMHNGKHTNRSGVFTLNEIPVTNLERTLIDITVRPSYAGGVYSVLEAYKKAIDKISINKLIALLDNINYIYPYHQSIGFYLEKAGFESDKLNALRDKKMEFNFYLTYEMQEKQYSKEWKLYYPKGL